MSCVSAKHSVATWLRLCMPCITRGSWQAMGEWQIGSLRKCEQREGRPSSIIESDTPRGILIKKLRDNHSDSGVGADGGDSWASGCTGLYQHLCSPHTRTELCPHCAHHTTHSPFQAGSRATCGCERLHRGGGRRRGRKGGVNWSEDQDGAQGRGGGGGGQNRPQNLIQDSTDVGFPTLDDGRWLS